MIDKQSKQTIKNKTKDLTMRNRNNNNYNRPSAADRHQWKLERLEQIGHIISTNTTDTILQRGLVIEHVDGSCYKILGIDGQMLFASHNKSKNLWKLWTDR